MDTSGIELYVKENNPKYLNTLIRHFKTYYKDNPTVDPYKMAHGLMPPQATSASDAKQMYINGHFCYANKFTIITNGLGIVRHIAFLDDDFKKQNPYIEIDRKSDSPDEDKSIGDSAFDFIEIYTFLKEEFMFKEALIPCNPRNKSILKKVGYNEYGYPLCPNYTSLVIKYCGFCRKKVVLTVYKSRCLAGWNCKSIHDNYSS